MSQVQQVKDSVNIVDVIGNRVSLLRAGTNFKGLCPFHGEKNPSFFVSETMQRFKCFGCGKTGDVLTFLQEYEGVSFFEALQSLADQVGIELQSASPTQEDSERQALLEVLDLSRAYYHFLLTEHAVGEQARAYLQERGIHKDTITQYQLGYSLPAWDGLVAYLSRKKRYDPDLIVKAGLAIQGKQRMPYDRFRSRVMFPLKNHRGQVVGFSGRTLSAEKEEPKYINTPETLLYHKSKLLFGFSEQLQPIRKERSVVVVEGEFDALSSAQAHVRNCVAIKGSALTADHAQILARSVDRIILSLDADSAGIEATRKAIDVVGAVAVSREQPLLLQVIRIPSGKDPDELSRKDPKAWRELVKRPITAYEFLITVAFERNDARTPEGKRQIMAELTPMLARIQHAVELEHYSKVVADELGVSLSSVQTDLSNYRKRQASGAPQQVSDEPLETKELDKQAKLEGYLLYLLAQFKPESRPKKATELLELATQLPSSKQIIAALGQSTAPYAQALKSLPDDVQQTAFEWLLNPQFGTFDTQEALTKEWLTQLVLLKDEARLKQGKIIETELSALDEKSELTPAEEVRQKELLEQLVKLRIQAPTQA